MSRSSIPNSVEWYDCRFWIATGGVPSLRDAALILQNPQEPAAGLCCEAAERRLGYENTARVWNVWEYSELPADTFCTKNVPSSCDF